MYETFLKLDSTLGGARCYGRWGSAHIAQSTFGGTRWFASYLNQPGSPVAGKILSIWPFYEKSETLRGPMMASIGCSACRRRRPYPAGSFPPTR